MSLYPETVKIEQLEILNYYLFLPIWSIYHPSY